MKKWKPVLAQSLLAGSLASIFSTAVLMLAGRREAGSAAAPVNAVSHWFWGNEALHRQQTDLGHTGLGYLTHHASAIFWAALYASLCRNRPASRTTPGILGGAAGASAIACLVDYTVTPKRLTPGFEHTLSTQAMAGVYAAMALGLAAGALAMRDHYHDNAQAGEEEKGQEPAPRIIRRIRAGSV